MNRFPSKAEDAHAKEIGDIIRKLSPEKQKELEKAIGGIKPNQIPALNIDGPSKYDTMSVEELKSVIARADLRDNLDRIEAQN